MQKDGLKSKKLSFKKWYIIILKITFQIDIIYNLVQILPL